MDNRTIDEIRKNETKLIRDILKLETELENKRKEYQETYKDVRIELKEKNQEIERLNNIINELEKWCNETMKKYKLPLVEQNKGALGFTLPIQDTYQQVLNKLKELKENNK